MNTRRRHRRNCNEPGHAHELTFSCYRRFPFLKSDQTCRWLAEAIDTARQKHAFDLWAYVFMPDHAHLIIRPREAVYDIAGIRKAIKAPVARQAIAFLEAESSDWLARITRRRGNKVERLFWQSGGGYDRNITQRQTLLSMIDYLHLNPCASSLWTAPASGVGRALPGTNWPAKARCGSIRSPGTGSKMPAYDPIGLGAPCGRPQPPTDFRLPLIDRTGCQARQGARGQIAALGAAF